VVRIIALGLFTLFFGAFFCGRARAQTINAASCNASDVQRAFNSVTASTTTVNIPAGTCVWTTGATLAVPSGNTTLSILGAGSMTTTGGGDATVITDGYNSGNTLLLVTTSVASSYFRMAGITFQGSSSAGASPKYGVVAIMGNSQSVRIDHSHFSSAGYSSWSSGGALLRFGGWLYGVTDHSIVDVTSSTNGIWQWDDSYAGGTNGNGAWADTTGLGSNRFMFVENNTINNLNGSGNGFGNDCFNGGRIVWRFNTLNSITLQTHPTTGVDSRGCRAWEVYDNTFPNTNGTNSPTYDNFFVDSGTGVIWGNASPASTYQFISLYSDRSNNDDHGETPCTSSSNCSASWGYCGTAFNGLGSTWDQNSGASTGYKCLDQPGTGKSDLLQGNMPNKCDFTSGQCAIPNYNGTWPNQAAEPFYEWLDAYSYPSGYGPYAIVTVNIAGGLLQNVDWYNNTQTWNGSSFTGTAFNGTAGTGYGTLASIPATCATGVGYWATDQGSWNTTSTPSPVTAAGTQGKLYVCSATNTWTGFYTPYTYPHPLDTQATTLAAPTNLQVTTQ
jgi:hypothetical protein